MLRNRWLLALSAYGSSAKASGRQNIATEAVLRSSVCKVRAVKTYAEAHNHLLVGEVRTTDCVAVELDCRSFHFGRLVNSLKDVRVGELGRRIIPWTHIEIINLLPTDFNYHEAELCIDREGNIFLKDRQHVCPITMRGGPRH